MKHDVFISYSHKDKQKALAIAGFLEKQGFRCWLDKGGLRLADLFDRKIITAIRNCCVVLWLASNDSLQSDYVRHEISAALSHGKPIVPIFLEPLKKDLLRPPFDQTPGVEGIEYFEEPVEEKLSRLVTDLRRLIRRQKLWKRVAVTASVVAVLSAALLTGFYLKAATPPPPPPPPGNAQERAPLQPSTTTQPSSSAPKEAETPLQLAPHKSPSSDLVKSTVQPTGQKPVIWVEEWTGLKKSKFSGFAFGEEGVVVRSTVAKSFSRSGESLNGAIVQTIFDRDSKRLLQDLRRFVEEGGRAAVMVCADYSSFNGDLQQVFDIAVVRESNFSVGTAWPTKDVILDGKVTQIKGAEYSPLFEGLTVCQWRGSGNGCYLVPAGKDWVLSHVAGDPKKYLSAGKEIGRGEILFLACFERGSSPATFIEDDMINLAQNMEASRRLIRWLAGKTEYPRPK